VEHEQQPGHSFIRDANYRIVENLADFRGWPDVFGGEIQKRLIYFVHRCLLAMRSHEAAAIASVHVGVIAWQQSRTTEQRTELHSGFIGLCLGAVAAFPMLRAASRD
jgi:hypothetical protein